MEDGIRAIVGGSDDRRAELMRQAEQAAMREAEAQESRHPEQMVGNMMKLHHQYQEALRRCQFLDPDDEQETAGNAVETERLRNETAHIVRKVLEDPKHYKAALKRADIAMFEVRSIACDVGVSDWNKNLSRIGLEM